MNQMLCISSLYAAYTINDEENTRIDRVPLLTWLTAVLFSFSVGPSRQTCEGNIKGGARGKEKAC